MFQLLRGFSLLAVIVLKSGLAFAQTPPSATVSSDPRIKNAFAEAFSAVERRDYVAAEKIWRSLAEEGNAPAQYNLGNMYLGGREGVPKSHLEAAKWMGRAAEQGDPLAQSVLGGLYESGWGVTQDYIEAYKWFALAHLRRKPIMGGTERDLAEVAKKMTPAQLTAAERLVREWKPTGR